ncbi:inosine/xanthosine triphosphatase [candidate division KSB1 bacterium]|nr:inosine/xanthosine triphosphatase [candidate division KSB1 bacterium]
MKSSEITDHKQIILASTNPVKKKATLSAFRAMFPNVQFTIEPINVPSGVSDQPKNSTETLTGARNRVQNARKIKPHADFWVGIEGGVDELENELAAFAWIIVESPELTGKSRTGTFFLPQKITDLIHQGKELGEADDIVFNQQNSKQKNGAIGLLTRNVVTRFILYRHAIILALVPFRNVAFYHQ